MNGQGATLETNVKAIELKDLWRKYKSSGSDRAREQLVVAYSPLVKYVAGRMSSGLPAHVEESDLISYGLIGLINAIERFDIDREIKFETYAITRIKGAIIDELRALDWVPRSVRARAREIERAHGKLEHRLHRTPTDEEMANELNLSVEEFQESLVKISNSTVVALDELWAVSDSSGDQVSLLDTLHDPDAPDPQQLLDASELKDRLADAISALPEREKLVIALYYYENLTLREIGEVLGVTESRISQLHTKAVLRLKSRLQGDNLRDWNRAWTSIFPAPADMAGDARRLRMSYWVYRGEPAIGWFVPSSSPRRCSRCRPGRCRRGRRGATRTSRCATAAAGSGSTWCSPRSATRSSRTSSPGPLTSRRRCARRPGRSRRARLPRGRPSGRWPQKLDALVCGATSLPRGRRARRRRP